MVARLLIKTLLFIFIAIGTIGGCGGGGNNNGGDLGLPDLCEEFIDAFCMRTDVCDISTFIECLEEAQLALDALFNVECDSVVEGPTFDQCLDDLTGFDCGALDDGEIPQTCDGQLVQIGQCEVCETAEDCLANLECFDCGEDCTGDVFRCSNTLFFIECEDGIF